jgi:hypothetical protein
MTSSHPRGLAPKISHLAGNVDKSPQGGVQLPYPLTFPPKSSHRSPQNPSPHLPNVLTEGPKCSHRKCFKPLNTIRKFVPIVVKDVVGIFILFSDRNGGRYWKCSTNKESFTENGYFIEMRKTFI